MKLGKVYEPGKYEDDIYALWEKSKAFEPKNRGSNDYFSLVIPPPNANADLHIGYGLTLAIEDIAVRYHRMKGEATLMLPGADHAGFETQVVYEKHLAKEGNDVEFKIHDIREEIEAVEEVDAIFCNNVLYHLRKDEAMKIVRNLAELLKAKGVLSFDFNTVKSDTEGKINIQTSRGWVTVSSEMLGLEFDLQPLRTLRGTEVFIRE